MLLINPKCKAHLTEVIVVDFPRVECYFMKKIWDFIEAFMTFTKTKRKLNIFTSIMLL